MVIIGNVQILPQKWFRGLKLKTQKKKKKKQKNKNLIIANPISHFIQIT